jgi:hypothetical protein
MDDERAARGRGRGYGLGECRRDEECERVSWSGVWWLSEARTAEAGSERRQRDSRRVVWASVGLVGLVGGEDGEGAAEDAAEDAA